MNVQIETATSSTLPCNAENMDDHAIVARICAGETCLYETIMRRYNQRLFRVARSIVPDDGLAEDAVQEAYVSAFYALNRYRCDGSFAAWLTQITINEARMSKRKRTRHPETALADIEDNLLTGTPRPQTNPAHNVANDRLARLIEDAVEQLPETFRIVFVMRAIQQLSVADTAATLQIPAGTVKTRYHRARNLMQASLDPHIEKAGLSVYEFAGARCDNMVAMVSSRLKREQ
jgi:RNA polymerase sigma-70 factor, ECF subfamily